MVKLHILKEAPKEENMNNIEEEFDVYLDYHGSDVFMYMTNKKTGKTDSVACIDPEARAIYSLENDFDFNPV